MTSERAQQIIALSVFGEVPMGFSEPCRASTFIPHPDGITREEDAEIKLAWTSLSGGSNYSAALDLFAHPERYNEEV